MPVRSRPPLHRPRRLVLALIAALIALNASCAEQAVTQTGAHTLLGQEDGFGANPAVTDPIDTRVSGSSFLAFSAGYAENTQGPTDNKGNTWSPLGQPEVYRGYNGQFDVKAYVALGGHGGNGHRLSIVKNGVPTGELTLPFVEIRDVAGPPIVARNYPAASSVLTSASVTTTGPATLVAVWWGDTTGLQHSAIPNNGFSVIEDFTILPPNSAVQCAVAVRQVSAAGTYNVSWATSPAQGAPLWLFAFPTATDLVFSHGFE